jgi:hypothetical protein
MIVKLSDWLISIATRYPPRSACCTVNYLGLGYTQAVTLTNVSVDQSERRIRLIWLFTELGNVRLNESTIQVLHHFLPGFFVIYTNVRPPSTYTWSEVALLEDITLINAV